MHRHPTGRSNYHRLRAKIHHAVVKNKDNTDEALLFDLIIALRPFLLKKKKVCVKHLKDILVLAKDLGYIKTYSEVESIIYKEFETAKNKGVVCQNT